VNRLKGLVMLVAGCGLGITLVLACGNDAPAEADAAAPVCDCPAAEPPLTPERVMQVDQVNTVEGETARTIGVTCPEGSIPLGGSCRLDNLDSREVRLVMAFQDQQTWVCRWDNPTAVSMDGTASVRCLLPAE
jgi:hypothetical protein